MLWHVLLLLLLPVVLLLLLLPVVLLSQVARFMSMVRQLLLLVVVGIKMIRLPLRGTRVDTCVRRLRIVPHGQCLPQNPKVRTSRGEVRTKQEKIADVRAGLTERRVEYRALPP